MFFHVALHRRLSYAGREPVKSAFYVTDPQAAHLVRIHALMTDQSPLNVEMFEELEAAAKWLGVPVKSLMPGLAARHLEVGRRKRCAEFVLGRLDEMKRTPP